MRLLRTLCHALVIATPLAAHALDGKPAAAEPKAAAAAAARIIGGRPYKAKDDLVLKKIKDRITAKQ